jgi:hypothetical protein
MKILTYLHLSISNKYQLRFLTIVIAENLLLFFKSIPMLLYNLFIGMQQLLNIDLLFSYIFRSQDSVIN